MPTYSTTVRSSSDDIVLDLQVRVEDRCVELGLAVEAVADALPIGGWLGHCRDSSMHAHVTMGDCYEEGKCCAEAQVGNMEMERARAGVATKQQGWSVPSRLVWSQYHFTHITLPSPFSIVQSEAQFTAERMCMT